MLAEDHVRTIAKLRFTELVYDTSKCSSQGFSWSPSHRSLNRSKLASTRLCNNHIIIIAKSCGSHRLRSRGRWVPPALPDVAGPAQLYSGPKAAASPDPAGQAAVALRGQATSGDCPATGGNTGRLLMRHSELVDAGLHNIMSLLTDNPTTKPTD